MKKHLSIFMLMVRSCVYPVLVILAAMAAAEAILVYAAKPGGRLLFELIDGSNIYYVFVVGVVLAMLVVLGACSFGSAKPRYTLARLSVSEKVTMFWHWLCGALVMLIILCWQMMLIYAIALWHSYVAEPGYISHQSIYLANFRSDFFHSVLPLEDVSRLVHNIVMALCIGGVCASSAFKFRRGKKAFFGPVLVAAMFATSFRIGHFEISHDAFFMCAYGIVTLISMTGVFTGDAEVDYEEAKLED